jgi:hypothetical protein
VTNQRTKLNVARVSVRIEVQHGDTAPPTSTSHTSDIGPGDRVITAENQGNRTTLRNLLHHRFECGTRSRGVAAEHHDVTTVNDLHVSQTINPQGKGRSRAIVCEIARGSHRLGAESCT